MTGPGAVGEDSPRLCLLGGWRLVLDGSEVELGPREQRLVALLGLTGRRARTHVAATLWPTSTDARALASLRRAVARTHGRCPGLIDEDRATIDLDATVEVDVRDLRRAVGVAEQSRAGVTARALLDVLRGDELLPGWSDDWVAHEREHLEQLLVTALEQVSREALEAGHLTLAVDAARAASDIEPLREPAREVTIRAHLARGEPGSAAREFHRYSDVLREELGVLPSGRIVELVDPVLRNGEEGPEESASAVPPPPRAAAKRGAVAWLVAFAGLVLTASLAIAVAGPDDRGGGAGGETGRQTQTQTQTRDATPSPAVTAPVAGADLLAEPVRRVAVRPLDAAAGNAVFAVRATPWPARVRMVVRGPAGAQVSRSLWVRGQDGRRLVLDGLVPGRYRWTATAVAATRVSGVVRVRPDHEPPAGTGSQDVVAASTGQATTPSETAGAASAPASAPGPAPSPAPSPAPGPAPAQSPTYQPSPTSQPDTTPTSEPPSEPTSEPSPDGQPTDPGTVPPPPVG